MSHLKQISDIIDKHRTSAYLTCPVDCWCWGVEAAICGHKDVQEHSFEADCEKQCSCFAQPGSDCDYFNNGKCTLITA